MSLVEKRLGELATYINGRGFKPAEWGAQGLPIVRIANLNNARAPFDYFDGALQAGHKIDDGDILVSWSATLDAFIWNRGPAVLNQHIFNVRPKDNVIAIYLYFVLKRAMKAMAGLAHGATMQHVTKPEFESFTVLIDDDPAVQQRVAARLTAQLAEVETVQRAARAQVLESELLRVRLLRQAFHTLRDAPLKVLGEWAKTTSGSTPSRGDKRYWSPAEVPWVKTGEVAYAPIFATQEAVSRLALAECSLTVLPPQTVLIAMYGQGKTRGQSAVLQVEATTNQACFAIMPNRTWDVDFLQYWLMASYEDLRSLSEGRGGNQANLNGALLNELEIPAPEIVEQIRLVKSLKAQLAEVDAIAQAAAAQLAEIERLPERLLIQAFPDIKEVLA